MLWGPWGDAVMPLTETLVGSLSSASSPGPVLVEGLAALAVGASRVVLAHARQLPRLIRRALAGVAVAFAPAKDPSMGMSCSKHQYGMQWGTAHTAGAVGQ